MIPLVITIFLFLLWLLARYVHKQNNTSTELLVLQVLKKDNKWLIKSSEKMKEEYSGYNDVNIVLFTTYVYGEKKEEEVLIQKHVFDDGDDDFEGYL